MTPDQFLRSLEKRSLHPAYLFAGPDAYMRRACRKALTDLVLSPEERESGATWHDLDEVTLDAVLDDARSFSLFTTNRLIWASGAEAAIPRTRAGSSAGEDQGTAALAQYLNNPTPGTVVVFDAARFGFEGEDKAKLERVQKFFAPVPTHVEFRPFTPDSARALARDLARKAGVEIGAPETGLLVDSVAGDAGRIAIEIEKLRLFVGDGGKITSGDIASLVPNAQSTTIFALVGALGRSERRRSLEALDALLKEGEYLPLVLTFLGTQFRLALAAQEAGLRNASQIQTYFTREGIRMWRDRAEQIAQTVGAFSKPRLERAIEKLYLADKSLRDARPDDRVVMEEFVLALTA